MSVTPQLEPNKPRILVIDDERFNLSALSTSLKDEHKVLVATSGEQGLHTAEQARPDLILLDVKMPGMDGYEVCRRLKADERTQNIPIIFITALADAMDETRGFELGAVDYIIKPFNLSVVRARVRTHLRLKRQSDLLEEIAFRDSLTGVPNRRAFHERRAQEWTRCRREGLPLSLILLDVDHFKLFNDHYGHGAGDECLARVARALASCLADADGLLARYGGEEFVAVLPSTDREAAHAVGEAFRKAVEALDLPHARSQTAHHVTISVGVATCSAGPTADPGTALDSAEQLTAFADQLLYQAKAGGRNQVRSAELA